VTPALGIVGGGGLAVALAELVAGEDRPVLLHVDAAEADGVRARREHPDLPGVALPPAVRIEPSLRDLAGAARLILCTAPAAELPAVARALGDVTGPSHILVHAVGALIGDDDPVMASAILRAETATRRVGVLAGPALARDLAARRPTAVVVASTFDEVIGAARGALAAPPALHVYGSHDLVGVELSAALAGIFSIAVGLADGLGFEASTRALLLCRAVAEGSRLVVAAGGRERTCAGLAGLGDILVRCSGAGEREAEYARGLALARGESGTEAADGASARAAALLARRTGVRTRILDAVAAVLSGELAPAAAADRLLETSTVEE
jgi:glycerol-3-phosphate dehydrogenase (NAD(P)+)